MDAGILPSLPGFFSNRDKNAQTLTGDNCVKSEQAETSKNSTDASIDRAQRFNSLHGEELERQLAASTAFIASLGTANGKRSSPSHRSMIVSRALRLLVQNMKLFGFFLIEVEDLRQQVNLLEARRQAALDTIKHITKSPLCSCMEQVEEEEMNENLEDDNELHIPTASEHFTGKEKSNETVRDSETLENHLLDDETDELPGVGPKHDESLQNSPSSLCQLLTGLNGEHKCDVQGETHWTTNQSTMRQRDKILFELNEPNRHETAVETISADLEEATINEASGQEIRRRKARRRNRKRNNAKLLHKNHDGSQ